MTASMKPAPIPALNPALKASGGLIRHVELEIDLSELVLDEAFQPRDGVIGRNVRKIQLAIREDEYINPVDVFLIQDGHGDNPAGRPYLVDGWHRVAAHEREGKTSILVNVYEGTRAQAFLHSGAANLGDSEGLTREQRKKFARDLLRIPEFFRKSARSLAVYTGLGRKEIGDFKREIKAADKKGVLAGIDPLRPRYVRNGVVLEMNATGIAESNQDRAAEEERLAQEVERTPIEMIEERELPDGRKVVEVLQVLPPRRDGTPGVVVRRAAPQEVPADLDVSEILSKREVDVKAILDDLELGTVLPDEPDQIIHGVRFRRYDLTRKAWHDLSDSRARNLEGCAPLEIVRFPARDIFFYAVGLMQRDGWKFRGQMRLANVTFLAFASGSGEYLDPEPGENVKTYLKRSREAAREVET